MYAHIYMDIAILAQRLGFYILQLMNCPSLFLSEIYVVQ